MDHIDRILGVIKQGAIRKSQLIKQTCLGQEAVSIVLTKLRKTKQIQKLPDGKYQIL